MLLPEDLYKTIKKYMDYKNQWILDLTSIDPLFYAPEIPAYGLAVQRRGLPFFYLARITFIAMLLMILARIMYGYVGGFRSEVKVIRKEKKTIANKVIYVGLFFFIWFGFAFTGASFKSIELTEEWFTEVIVGYAVKSRDTLKDVVDVIDNINTGIYPAFYSQFEFDKFHISQLVKRALPEAEESIKKAKIEKEKIQTYHRRHLIWCFLVLGGAILSLIAFFYSYKKRKRMMSLAFALFLIAICGFGLVVNGFYFNFATVKTEMCVQTSDVISRGNIPLFGSGIASIVSSFSTESKTAFQEQIYEFNIAINSAYLMYRNRLEALGKTENLERVKKFGTWELFLDYARSKHTDYILTNCFKLLTRIWRMYYQLDSLIEMRNLKQWSFLFSNKVCKRALEWDVASFTGLFLCLASMLVIAFGGWMNEWIILCILWEESQFLNIEKYRFDWL